MDTKRNSSLNSILSILLILSAVTSCRSANDGLQGTAKERMLNIDRTKSGLDGKTSSEVLENSTLDSKPITLPGVYTSGTSTSESGEQVEAPSSIAGALLFCFKDKAEGLTATFLCELQDPKTQKPINLAREYTAYNFGFRAPSELSITVQELPVVARWQAEFSVTAASVSQLESGLKNLFFSFEGTKASTGILDTLAAKPIIGARPDLTLRSLKPQALATDVRCLDMFRSGGQNIVAAPCNAQAGSGQDWFLTAASTLAHVSGSCLRFDPVTKLAIEGDCADPATPRFDLNINGNLMQIRDTGTCLAVVNPDSSGVDSVAALGCNLSDPSQHWKVGARVQ